MFKNILIAAIMSLALLGSAEAVELYEFEVYYAHVSTYFLLLIAFTLTLYAVVKTFKPLPLPWKFFTISMVLFLQWTIMELVVDSLEHFYGEESFEGSGMAAYLFMVVESLEAIFIALAFFFFYRFTKLMREVFV